MSIPKKLYKYRNVDDRTRDIIVNHRVYFCAPADLNDPFDCKMPLDFEITDAEFRQWARKVALNLGFGPADVAAMIAKCKAALPPDYFEELKQKFLNRISLESSVFCVSERPDDILMFSHYSACHTGCCLELISPETCYCAEQNGLFTKRII